VAIGSNAREFSIHIMHATMPTGFLSTLGIDCGSIWTGLRGQEHGGVLSAARSTAAARVAAASATRTAASTAPNVPVTWAAKQSGKRLTVRPTRRQMNRRISAPRGCTRG